MKTFKEWALECRCNCGCDFIVPAATRADALDEYATDERQLIEDGYQLKTATDTDGIMLRRWERKPSNGGNNLIREYTIAKVPVVTMGEPSCSRWVVATTAPDGASTMQLVADIGAGLALVLRWMRERKQEGFQLVDKLESTPGKLSNSYYLWRPGDGGGDSCACHYYRY